MRVVEGKEVWKLFENYMSSAGTFKVLCKPRHLITEATCPIERGLEGKIGFSPPWYYFDSYTKVKKDHVIAVWGSPL